MRLWKLDTEELWTLLRLERSQIQGAASLRRDILFHEIIRTPIRSTNRDTISPLRMLFEHIKDHLSLPPPRVELSPPKDIEGYYIPISRPNAGSPPLLSHHESFELYDWSASDFADTPEQLDRIDRLFDRYCRRGERHFKILDADGEVAGKAKAGQLLAARYVRVCAWRVHELIAL